MDVQHAEEASDSQNESACIFCDKVRKRHNFREQVLYNAKDSKLIDDIKNCATAIQDGEMLHKLEDFDRDKSITYHDICKKNYLKQSVAQTSTSHTEFYENRELYK